MKVVAINGSARKDGNTAILVNKVFDVLSREGIETEIIQLAGQHVRGCLACRKCFEKQNGQCIQHDAITPCIDKMREADAIILASPTYYSDVTTELKALIDRAGYVARANGDFLKRKIGAAILAVRRGGVIHGFDTINHFFLITQMIIPGSNYWNFGIGREIGDVEKDEEGLQTMKVLGENMAWLIKKVNS